jgi:hypothetical protein
MLSTLNKEGRKVRDGRKEGRKREGVGVMHNGCYGREPPGIKGKKEG